MNNNQSSLVCMLGSWGLAFGAGVVAAIMLMLLGGWSIVQAIFAAIVILIIVGALVSWIACRPLPAPGAHMSDSAGRDHPVKSSAEQAADAAAQAKSGATASAAPEAAAAPAKPSASPAAAAAAAKAGVKPSTPLAGEAELSERKGTWKYEAPGAKTAAPKKAAAKPAAATPAAEAGSAPAAAADKPEGLSAAREGGPDDLKMIKGVGPKLEKLLHSMGYFHFDQIAAWRKKEVAWVDENLEGFKGRVTRDEWVKQAKVLAKGGSTEFSKKVGKGDVY